MLFVEKLEKLLLRNWASFINLKPFTDYILSLVQVCELQVVSSDKEYPLGIQLKLSQFKLVEEGFIIWVEFSIQDKKTETIIGTSELLLMTSGIFKHQKTIGTLVKKI